MMQNIIAENQLAFYVIVVAASLYLMAKASDLAVYGVSRYARKLGLSDYIIGMVVVAIASSMPELVSSITGAAAGEPGIVLGTLFGSNLAGLALVLGISTILSKKISTKSKVLEGTNKLIWILVMLPFALLLDGNLTRFDGFVLVGAYFFYIIYLWRKEGKLGKVKKKVKIENLWKDGFVFSGSLVVILLSARYLVFSSIMLANYVGIDPYIVALTIIAIGATMPDIMVSIKSAKQGHQGVGYGNVVGSMVIKALLFLGAIAIITPIEFAFVELLNIMIFRTIMITLVLWWATKNFITWKQGVTLLVIYLIFLIIQILLG